MRGDPAIIELLNEVLTGELTAVNQYFLEAKMQANWGFKRLSKHVYDESIDEMRHAEKLIDRILFLDGHPNLQRLGPVGVGENVQEQLELDLAVEMAAIELLNNGIAQATAIGDNGTRELLADILVSEEEHIDWLETQLSVIATIGLDKYLAEQLYGDDD